MQTVATTRSSRHTNENPKVPQQPHQPQTAKEVIAANVQALIEQLEAGHSDALTAYLNAMSRFHSYSLGNILQIARQKPEATRVAGFWKWKELGRSVKKGEKGIRAGQYIDDIGRPLFQRFVQLFFDVAKADGLPSKNDMVVAHTWWYTILGLATLMVIQGVVPDLPDQTLVVEQTIATLWAGVQAVPRLPKSALPKRSGRSRASKR